MELDRDINRVTEELNLSSNGEHALNFVKYDFLPIESADFSKYFDHTLLKTDATPEQIDTLCEEAQQWKFKSVCVRVNYVSRAVENLRGSGVDVCCVVGFHEGTYTTEEKHEEALKALQLGAVELDFVVNYPLLKAREYHVVYTELKYLRDAVSRENKDALCKLILETSQLSQQDIVAGTVIAYSAGFDFAKTSTGFMGHGARVEDVQIMRKVADISKSHGTRSMRIKASGGIRVLQDATKMLEAGAERLGCSAGVAIMSNPVHFSARSGEASEAHDTKEISSVDGY